MLLVKFRQGQNGLHNKFSGVRKGIVDPERGQSYENRRPEANLDGHLSKINRIRLSIDFSRKFQGPFNFSRLNRPVNLYWIASFQQ